MFTNIVASPYFSAPSRLVTVKKGDTANLHCDVNGDKPLSVIWLRGSKTELNPSTNYRVHVKQDVTPDGVAAELQIVSAEATDSGAYFCQASNMYGRDQQLVQLLVQEPPISPQSLDAAMVSSRSVNLKWQHKSGDSNEVFKFIVEYREMDRKYGDPPKSKEYHIFFGSFIQQRCSCSPVLFPIYKFSQSSWKQLHAFYSFA